MTKHHSSPEPSNPPSSAADAPKWDETVQNGTEIENSGLPSHRSGPEPSNPSSSAADAPKWDETVQNGTEIEKSGLSSRQQEALPIIAAAPTLAEAARSAGIGHTTLYRWLEDDRFRYELTRLREQSADLARQELQGLMLRSVSVLAEALEDPDKDFRLRAARYSLTFAGRIAETQGLLKKIDSLEQSLPLWGAHHKMK